MAESKGSKSSGFVWSFTASGAVTEGDLIEQTTTEGTVQTCATKESIKIVGQASVGCADAGKCTVQFAGIVAVNGRKNSATQYQTAIVAGERVMVGSDATDTSGILGQVVVHAPASASTPSDLNTDGRKPIGSFLAPVSSDDTNTIGNLMLNI